jgi:hypothetical protein
VISYTDGTVAPATTYTYRVIAFNNAGDSIAYTMPPITTGAWLPADSVTLTPNLPSGTNAGVPVIFTASGSLPPGTVPAVQAAYDYRFWVDGVLVQNYGNGANYTLPSTTLPGTYLIRVDVRTSGAVDLDTWTAVSYTLTAAAGPPISYVLWTNTGAGQGIQWILDPVLATMLDWGWISPAAGVGAGWEATNLTRVDAMKNYVLWSNRGTGQAIRWSVNPGLGTMISWNWISAPAGIGAGWQATGYARGDATTDYVLWTNSSTGQATRWKVAPATGAYIGYDWISAPAGIGAGWQASDYTRTAAGPDYVLWTNSGSGLATRWKVDKITGAYLGWNWVSSPAGIGAGWQASSYALGGATTDYVIWTNSSTGQATRWSVNPTTAAMTTWDWISSPAGVGAGWHVMGYEK